MAGDWIPVRDDLCSVREVIGIAKRIGKDRRWVAGALIQFWGWAQNETTNGEIVDADVDALVDALNLSKQFFLAVIEVGWLIDGVGGKPGVTIPNFDNWLSDNAKCRLQKNKRQKKWRAGRPKPSTNVDGDVDRNASTTEENRREEIEEEGKCADAPSSTPKRSRKPKAPNYDPAFIGSEPTPGDGALPPALAELFKSQGKDEAYKNVWMTEAQFDALVKKFGEDRVEWAAHQMTDWSLSLEISAKTNLAGWQSYRLKRDHAAALRNQILRRWPELKEEHD